MSRRRFLGLLACGLVLLVLTGSGLYAQEGDDIAGFVAVALAQGGVYLAALWLTRGGAPSHRTMILILGVAAVMRILVLGAPPYLSSDVYRYVWDGRVLAAGINPYRYIPTDPHLANLRDAAIFPEINRGNYAPTIYPPAAQVIFFAVTRISESLLVMRISMVAFEAIAVVLLLRLLALAGLPAARIIVYAWHPLPLWEFAGSGHIDAAIIAFTALALWSRAQSPSFRGKQRRNPKPRNPDRALAGLALAAGTLAKFYPAVLLPALWRRGEWRMPGVLAAVVVLSYLPFLGAGRGIFGFLPGYLAEEGFTSGAGFYLWGVAKAILPLGGVPDIAYLIVVVLLLTGLALYVVSRRSGPEADVFGAALLAGVFVVLLSPHYPWYFAWLIVFASLVPAGSLLWLTLASFLLYLVPVGSHLVRDQNRVLVETAIYVPALALAAIDLWRRHRREQLRHGDKTG